MSALTIREPNDPPPAGYPSDYTVPGKTAREVFDLLLGHFGATMLNRGEIDRDGTITVRVRDATITIAPTAGGAR